LCVRIAPSAQSFLYKAFAFSPSDTFWDLKLKKEEIDLLIARAEFYRKRRLLEQRVDIFTEMFRKELIDASTFETKLKELGLSTENVNLIVAYEKAKKGIAS
jgi:hypothetical protein